jgi:hypothetical protein
MLRKLKIFAYVAESMNFPDFDDYDLENTELCAVNVRRESATLTFHCSIVGWDWKSTLNFLKRLFTRNSRISQNFDVELQVTFTGIEWIGSAGESFSENANVEELFNEGPPLLMSAFYFKKAAQKNHTCFVFESGTVDILYSACTQDQVPNDAT